jgi:integrase
MPRLTDKLVRDMPIPEKGKQLRIKDKRILGFGVRRTASGSTSFTFDYVAHGRDRRMTIGPYPSWSVEAAREAAAKLRRRVDAGEDPLEEDRQARAEMTLALLWERYDREVMPDKRPATQRDERSMWRRLVLPRLGRRKLSAIRPADIDGLHREISQTTPTQANRCLASVRHVFNKGIRWQLCETNPAVGAAKNPEEHRERYLTDDERERFLDALNRRPETSSTLALRMLLLTGARRNEVLKADWEQFDIAAGVWTKPSSHTKQKRRHRVPLSPEAVAIIQRARQLSNGIYVFPGKEGRPLADLKRLFASLLTETGIENLRLHDLRHSFASILVTGGQSLPVIGALLGHTQVATTARYSHLMDDALRDAASAVGRRYRSDA